MKILNIIKDINEYESLTLKECVQNRLDLMVKAYVHDLDQVYKRLLSYEDSIKLIKELTR